MVRFRAGAAPQVLDEELENLTSNPKLSVPNYNLRELRTQRGISIHDAQPRASLRLSAVRWVHAAEVISLVWDSQQNLFTCLACMLDATCMVANTQAAKL